jgi:PAS domain S-box-containing protein
VQDVVGEGGNLPVDMDHQRSAPQSLSDRDSFDSFHRLLSEISARFIMIPPHRLTEEIEASLRQMLDFFQVDRCALLRTLPGKKAFQIAYLATADDVPAIPYGPELPRSLFPWGYDKLTRRREVIAIHQLDDLPPEASADRQTRLNWSIRSSLAVPIILSESSDWVISANQTRRQRRWTEEVIQQFKLLGEILVSAIERCTAESALRQSEEFLKLATDAADVGLWSISPETLDVWASAKMQEIFHLPPGEAFHFDELLSRIHPEDRLKIQEAFTHTAEKAKERQSLECRIVRPDGTVRWVLIRGRSFQGPPGAAQRILGATVDITDQKNMEEQLRLRLNEIASLKVQLERENEYLRDEVRLRANHEEIVGPSSAMRRILAEIEQVAEKDVTVLLQGETGTGKELLAHAIHRLSPRRDRPLVAINCAALPPTLIENELFGREKGAYTGALTRMVGRFELADKGTLFLDEIGELPLDLQAKLLHVLEEGRFERLGSHKTINVDVRIIAATNRDLAQEVAAGRFRRDLYYRLNVFPIWIPPLRERPEDIPPLVWTFVKQLEKKLGRRIDHIPRRDMEALQRYPWPGNARELKNTIERAMIVSKGSTLRVRPPGTVPELTTSMGSLEELERQHILSVLEKTGWRIGGKGGAAETLNMKRTTLQSKMKKLGIKRPGA